MSVWVTNGYHLTIRCVLLSNLITPLFEIQDFTQSGRDGFGDSFNEGKLEEEFQTQLLFYYTDGNPEDHQFYYALKPQKFLVPHYLH